MAVTIDGSAGVTTNAGGSVNPSTTIDGINYSCRAWVNFNGTGTVAIRASGNVTNITDNSVGNYTINFTNAMPDNNYAFAGASGSQTNSGVDNGVNTLINRASTSSCQFATRNVQSSGAGTDYDSVNVSIFR